MRRVLCGLCQPCIQFSDESNSRWFVLFSSRVEFLDNWRSFEVQHPQRIQHSKLFEISVEIFALFSLKKTFDGGRQWRSCHPSFSRSWTDVDYFWRRFVFLAQFCFRKHIILPRAEKLMYRGSIWGILPEFSDGEPPGLPHVRLADIEGVGLSSSRGNS